MTSQQRLVVVIAILASFVAFLDGSVVNVALPAIRHSLGGGLATQQWVVDAYLITLVSLMLIAGSFSDLFGRVKILTLGLVGFGAASLLCAFAPSGLFLIIARALQGVAGALLVPSSLALIIAAFTGKEQGKAIGSWTAWTGIAFIVGPLLGGFLVDSLSWRWIFAINVLPIAVTLGLLQYLEVPERIKQGTHIDYVGAVLCALGLGGPVYALIEQSRYGWSSPVILLPLIGGLIALICFILFEKKAKHPMLPLGMFAVRNFGVGNAATLSIYAGLSIATFLVTIFIQQVGGYTAIQAGLALLPITIMMFFLSSRFGALSSKFGPRLFMAAGPFIASLGFFLMLRVNGEVHYLSVLFPAVVVFGLGLSITVAPLTAAILGSISAEQAGIGSAINNAVARIAGLVAIAALSLATGTSVNVDSFHRGAVLTALLLLIGSIISAVGITNRTARTQK